MLYCDSHCESVNVFHEIVDLCPVAEESDQTVLPRAKIEGGSWTQLMQSVRSRAGSRPGLETLVICAFITATHDPSCEFPDVKMTF